MPPPDARDEVRAARRAQQLRWTAVLAGILLLLSFFSAGFFLYAALVVAGLLATGLAVASGSRAGLQVSRRIERTEMELGEAVDASVSLRNGKALPAPCIFWRDQVEPGLDVEGQTCAFETLAANGEGRLSYRLHSLRRGLFRIGPAVVEASGPFGLVRRFQVEPDTRFVTVYPRIVSLGEGWPLGQRPVHEVPRRRSLFEDPSRFFGVRPFRPGDGLRRIHWRATARTGEIQVKVFEPAVLSGILLAVEMGTAAYPKTETDGEENREAGDLKVEAVVTAAASLAEFVLAGGQKVALLSNGADAAERYPDDWSGGTFRRLEQALAEGELRRRITGDRPVEVEPGKGAWHRDRLRAALARLTPAPSISLPELLTLEIPRLPRSLVLMVVTPDVTPTLGAALGGLSRSGIEAGVVWVQPGAPADDVPAAVLPTEVPVWAVRSDEDLERLGSTRL